MHEKSGRKSEKKREREREEGESGSGTKKKREAEREEEYFRKKEGRINNKILKIWIKCIIL